MPEIFRKVLALLSPKERRQAYLLMGMILIMAFLDVVGIASIMPFMAVLASPDSIETNVFLRTVYDYIGFTDPESFLFFLGIVVFIALVISITFKATTTWAITRFTEMRTYSLARRLVKGYMAQPYEWFLGRHSSDLGKTVLSEVELVVRRALVPLMQLIAQVTVTVAILSLLVAVDPSLALIVGLGMGGAYGLIYTALRRLLDRIGRERVAVNAMRFKALSESFGGIKEIKLGGLESVALGRFDRPAQRHARTQVTALIVAMLPRYALEMVAFGGMLLLAVSLLRSEQGIQGALPIMSLYALAGYRLMPALQLAYQQAATLRFADSALEQINQEISGLKAPPQEQARSADTIVPQKAINLDSMSYWYPNSESPAVKDINLTISAGSIVGIVGTTGSGKTTTVDIILGLLEPQEGSLQVDGRAIKGKERRAWQRSLGYVPQHIFLTDESVAENIAFGIGKCEIDIEAVEYAARIASMHDFIVEEMPNGYDTVIGERGIRLSGGQRQRIGIARAMYRHPSVLVLDEATSALDNVTEQAVMDAVHRLEGEITVIIIAHRLSTVRECDHIYMLESGGLVAEGTFDDLAQTNEQFRAMTRA